MVATNTDGRGGRIAAAAKRGAFRLIVAATAVGAALITYAPTGDFSSLDVSDRSMQNGAAYNKYADTPQAGLEALGPGVYPGFTSGDVSNAVGTPDNGAGAGTQGQFRIICSPSHFAMDDPIIKPNKPGGAHLHMFWGNTLTGAHTTFAELGTGSEHDLLNRGGSTCQGGPGANRSAYWIPAILDGAPGPNQKVIYPEVITLYYKSRFPYATQLLPEGINLLVGNVTNGSPNTSFTPSQFLHWGCYDSGAGQVVAPLSGTIPGATNGAAACPAGRQVQASMEFPQCIATDDGTATGNPILTSANFQSHTFRLPNYTSPCQAPFPYQVPQISYLIRFPAGIDTSGWRLASDSNWDQATVPFPGGSLHGDWMGGWNQNVHQAWLDGCMDPDTNPAGGLFTNAGVNNFAGKRNCSLGQTGPNQHWENTGQARNLNRQTNSLLFAGPYSVTNPCPDCRPIP